MATDNDQRTTDRIVDALLRTAQTTNTTLPAGLDLESIVNDRYAGGPAVAFAKRLEATTQTGWTEHEDAIRELAPQLAPGFVWRTLLDFDQDARLASNLVVVGALPQGDDLVAFLRRNATLAIATRVLRDLAHMARWNNTVTVTVDQVLDLVTDTAGLSWPTEPVTGKEALAVIQLLEKASDAFDLTRSQIARARVLFELALPDHFGATAVIGNDEHLPARISDDIADELLAVGNEVDFAIVSRWGRVHATITSDRFTALVSKPTGLALLSYSVIGNLSSNKSWNSDFIAALTTAARERPHELLKMRYDAREYAAQHLRIADDAVAVELGTNSVAWLCWGQSDARIKLALEQGKITARMVVWAAGHGQTTLADSEMFACCVREVPGVAAEFFDLAVMHHGRHETQAMETLMPIIAATLGDDARIWKTFITSRGNLGPFADRPLAEAACVYRARYAEADTRQGRRSRLSRGLLSR